MNKNYRERIENIIKERKHAHGFYNKYSETYKSFLKMEEETFKDKKLNKMTKELIAIGISIVINCESCLEWHIHEAIKGGADEKDIIEAIEVGIEMGGGPATVSSRFALKVLEYYIDKTF